MSRLGEAGSMFIPRPLAEIPLGSKKLTACGLLKVVCGTDTLGGVRTVMEDKLKTLMNPRALTLFTVCCTFR